VQSCINSFTINKKSPKIAMKNKQKRSKINEKIALFLTGKPIVDAQCRHIRAKSSAVSCPGSIVDPILTARSVFEEYGLQPVCNLSKTFPGFTL
jgi:hypothetical protein